MTNALIAINNTFTGAIVISFRIDREFLAEARTIEGVYFDELWWASQENL